MGLKVAPRADKTTLIRRVSYTLTGLPPTPEAIREFKEDESPQAFENLIDRLLASQRYVSRVSTGLMLYGMSLLADLPMIMSVQMPGDIEIMSFAVLMRINPMISLCRSK